MSYEVLIGLEIHIELKTKSKIFCRCSTEFGREPNTQTCPVCLGLPGILPMLNKKVVEYGIMAGLALNCNISEKIDMDRKNYFYPDLVKGFQTTQYFNPLCKDGYIELNSEDIDKKIRIKRIHIEEDTGKTIYDEKGNLYLDYNRSGVPLIEVVTEPDINSSKELQLFLNKLKSIIEYTEISDCKMEEGSLRCDVNINLIDKNTNKKTEISELKNLNSFRSIIRATEYEINRHTLLLKNGEIGNKETRRWDEGESKTYLMRKKDSVENYMYFHEGDIKEVLVDKELISNIRKKLPEFSWEKKERFIKYYNLPEYDSEILTNNKYLSVLFESTNKYTNDPKSTSNWIMGDVIRRLNEDNIDVLDVKFKPEDLAELINMVNNREISNNAGKKVLKVMFEENKKPREIINRLGLSQINDEEKLKDIVKAIVLENEQSVEEYRNGKERVLGFLIGQVMKETKGKANPKKVNKILLSYIN
ncbi:aspartyl/glutamyl-tRNA(Asn/Gln) amidotransferase subunit B [Gottschalkia acidurici 9a]|uniref:Aspartyl/glutamyl-tRNA(Asn/Gln) amidotransferase subunit B n=1 Tax=Gottschalkia acidurici (strain ATCC 7906 / DSM 604 / BCRC 14475 / CIP 104303 / KCTC 5404 / NCIMB 10678 / 9a) TaxID=1128398 RepID=K0AXF3_GOTA9|nr:Asp-tRNA(Asn)/Glu-tRNA(Gln) amidotransferase subunit GatB [Gottschalkia acidurici]AFS77395.1 aspartyl/glutamyl-tRNA(Asn/Gln) amidotransferase subunit B [Gottschalkia acidurici 9a]